MLTFSLDGRPLRPASFGAALACCLALAANAGELAVESNSGETVFSWLGQRCDDNAIPDSPARALRLPDGRVLLMAAHYDNRVLVGRDFSRLTMDCGVSASGAESADPAAFDDRYWVQAFLPPKDGRIIGLASHEFHGKRHPGTCSLDPTLRVRCWYSSIVAVEAKAEKPDFALLAPDARVIAAPPRRYSADGPPRYGFFTVSNAVRREGFLYAFLYQEGIGGKGRSGNCLFRASESDPLRWAALSEDKGWTAFVNPYTRTADAASSCMTIGKGVFAQAVRSVIFLKPWRQWVAVFSRRSLGPDGGVYYATSTDLLEWTRPRLLLSVTEPWADRKGCGTYFAYPSLIDHGSDSALFDTGGDDVWLYLTRFNYENCVKGLNRDLVRYKVTVR